MSAPSAWVEAVRRIVAEVARSDATELELSHGSFRLRLRRRPELAAEAGLPAEPRPEGSSSTLVKVAAPLTGIFYRAPSPTAAPYVEEGDWVEPQTVIGLIETMKVFNEVTADVFGRVVAFHAQSGELVHAGEPLLSVEPAQRPHGAPTGAG